MTDHPASQAAAEATEQYDLIIVGSGSGNSIPEFLADWKIALVERDVFGGTCLNRGCIPSKMFVLPADVALAADTSERLGIDTQFNGADWPMIRDRIFGRIDPISAGGREYRATGTPNLTLIEGTARFIGDRTFIIEGDDIDGHDVAGADAERRTITAKHVLIAAGSRPTIPPIDGLVQTGFHTSDSIMRLDELPKRLGIIGGGFIAAEMGHVFSALGSDVILFARSAGMLRAFDEEVAQRFTEMFGTRIDLHLGQAPSSVRRGDHGIEIVCGDAVIVVDELLVATGRQPNSDLLDADVGGIALGPHGTIEVDDTLATNVEGVWAIGDVANNYQLKHLANAEAKVAFWNIAHPDDIHHQSYKAVPSAVFSSPQVATVGLTEREATEQGLPFVVGIREYAGTAYGWALVDTTSFAKVLVNTETGLIIGAHIIGQQAASLIQPIVQAMEFDQSAADVALGVFYIHPALTEVVENALLEALDQIP